MVLCAAASYWLAGSATSNSHKLTNDSGAVIIDDKLYQTARRIALEAGTAEEQDLARRALHLADRELDEAFASALREAVAKSANQSEALKEIAVRMSGQRAKMQATQTKIEKLIKLAPADEDAAIALDLERAQQNLNQDDLEDLQQEEIRKGGNLRAKVDTARVEHEAAEHTSIAWAAPISAAPETMWLEIDAWRALSFKRQRVLDAAAQAEAKAARILRERGLIQAIASKQNVVKSGETAVGEDSEETLNRLRSLSDHKKMLLELGKREDIAKQLAEVYRRWVVIADGHMTAMLQLLLRSLAAIFAVILAVLIAIGVLQRTFAKQQDRRRFHQYLVIGTIALRVIGLIVIALLVFGPPKDVSMVLGLATAGLTVALKDFILAFAGWFVLIGKNGVSLGDWVEIEGIGGEVIEIGVLNTVLLEMGNWSNTGHPTGRRVSFVNKYAIERHFFNFSTEGQWLWDELHVTLPGGGNTYQTAQEIRGIVEEATAEDAQQAEADWQRVTNQYGQREFSAKPALDLRPSLNGIDVIVRYITRAPQRYAVKSRLFEALVKLLKTV